VLLANAHFGGEQVYVRLYRKMGVIDEDTEVRAAAAFALGAHGGPEDAPVLAELFKDQSPFVRFQAARGLQKIHNPEVVKALVAQVSPDNEENADVRAAVAYALGQYPQEIAYQALISALDDRSYGVVAAASGSLQTLTGHSVSGDDGRLWNQWESKHQGNLFDGGGTYVWHEYQSPERWFKLLAFWSWGRSKDSGNAPRGMATGPDQSAMHIDLSTTYLINQTAIR